MLKILGRGQSWVGHHVIAKGWQPFVELLGCCHNRENNANVRHQYKRIP